MRTVGQAPAPSQSALSHAGVAVSGRGHMVPNTRDGTPWVWLQVKPPGLCMFLPTERTELAASHCGPHRDMCVHKWNLSTL